ncbi:MAG: MBL fold metallo-hydrolase [Bacteroidota bacterium]
MRTAAHLQTDDLSIVIDTGPDFRQQMLREKVGRLDAVLFTHAHKDHVAGMDDIRSFYFRQKAPLELYGSSETFAQLRQEFAYVFGPTDYPGAPAIQTHLIQDQAFQIGELSITPLPVMHRHMPVLGFRIGDFVYLTDCNYIPPETEAKLQGVKVLILNALRRQKHYSHFTLEEALAWVEKLQPEAAYFTHLSHQMGKHADVSRELPAHVQIAYDGLKLHYQGDSL